LFKKKNKILVVILARAGSIRLKNKNLRKINNKNLVSITIDFAKTLFNKNDILLSTDSNVILNEGLRSGILAPWLRPKKLSGRYSNPIKSILHAVNWYSNYFSNDKDSVLLLQPTSPFRSLAYIKRIIFNYKKYKNRYSFISITPIHLMQKENFNTNILVDFDKNNFINLNRKGCFFINGSAYISSIRFLQKYHSFYKKKYSKGILNLNKKNSLDIDTYNDLKIARKYE